MPHHHHARRPNGNRQTTTTNTVHPTNEQITKHSITTTATATTTTTKNQLKTISRNNRISRWCKKQSDEIQTTIHSTYCFFCFWCSPGRSCSTVSRPFCRPPFRSLCPLNNFLFFASQQKENYWKVLCYGAVCTRAKPTNNQHTSRTNIIDECAAACWRSRAAVLGIRV